MDNEDPWKGILSAVSFAVRSTIHTTTQKTPAQLVFGRDMMFNIKHMANWEFIRARKQALINKNNERENSKRVPHNYKEGDLVLLKIGSENKYETPFSGPHQITSVNDNGTVRLQKGAVEDTVNIRRLFPYKSPRIINHGGECNAPPLRRNPRRADRHIKLRTLRHISERGFITRR